MRITVWHREQRLWREFTAGVDTGEILIPDVPPGTVALQVRPRDYPWLRLGEHSVTAGAQVDLGTIVLAHAGRVAGTLRGGADEHLDSLVFVLVDDTGLENGVVHRSDRQFRSGPIAAGEYTLMVRGDFVRSQRFPFTLRTGREETLDIDLGPAGMRRLRLAVPANAAAVKWAWGHAIDETGAVVWQQAGIRPENGLLEARVSAVPGSYRVTFNTDGGLSGQAGVTIDGLGESEPQTIALRHAPAKE